MESDDERIHPYDKIIIEEVEANRQLYVTSENTGKREDRLRAFYQISRILEKRFDVEAIAEEIGSRWNTIRKNYARALRNNKTYYLHRYLTFLDPHIKITRKPYVPYTRKILNVSPIEIVSDVEDDEEEEQNKIENTNTITSVHGKKLSAAEFQNKACTNQEDQNEYNKKCNKVDDKFWDMNTEYEYWENLKKDLNNVPVQYQILCMIEIFEKIRHYNTEL